MPRIVTMAFALGKQIYSEKEEMEIRSNEGADANAGTKP
jgi:hypothetical protein